MRGVNKVILVGTLGANPESRTFPNGGSVCQFSIATSEKWQNKQSGEWIEQTEWHRIVIKNRLGEIAQQYLKKGSKVYIEGSLRTRQWTDQNGQERYTTEIRGEQMQMLDSSRPQTSTETSLEQNIVSPLGIPKTVKRGSHVETHVFHGVKLAIKTPIPIHLR